MKESNDEQEISCSSWVAINLFCVQSFCVSASLVMQLNSEVLLQRLRQNGVRHPYHTRALSKFVYTQLSTCLFDQDTNG